MVFGCVAAIATSSMTTELAKGKPLDEARTITDADITQALGDCLRTSCIAPFLGQAR